MTPETQEVLEIAREWRLAATDDAAIGRGAIARFLKVWIAFNALYALRAGNVEGDRKQLERFTEWLPVRSAHERGLSQQVYRRSVESLEPGGIRNYQKNCTLLVRPPYACLDVLDAVYQVRCNLFHGKKAPTNLRDAQLVQSAGNIISFIVNSLLDDSAIWSDAAA
jgi:hypothetical protein